jgi:hypothetical protein
MQNWNGISDILTPIWAILILVYAVNANVSIDQFFPYGPEAGDSQNQIGDDGFAGPISLRYPFPFFNNTYTQLFVNNNGAISFLRGISTHTGKYDF